MPGAALSENDRILLSHMRKGATLRQAAERMHYTGAWGKWRSRQIKDALGVSTLEEALRMTEEGGGISRQEFDGLRSLIQSTNEAVEALAKAVTPTPAQQVEVRERELSEKEMAAKLGITVDDLKHLREENEYKAFKSRQERLEKERAEEEEQRRALEPEPERDGLGGLSNLVRRAAGQE